MFEKNMGSEAAIKLNKSEGPMGAGVESNLRLQKPPWL